ncbi:MAG TPA: inorganic diphosphatase [Chloroflexota bacterium]|jgi:inorganic pyrophosphatase|nr:inorganic diphosphatase [Chloroflexota bacterium]
MLPMSDGETSKGAGTRGEGGRRDRGARTDIRADAPSAEHETVLWVTIEIPRGSRNKYEYDDALGHFRLDRTLHSSVHYPTDYGFIPDTLAPDGDHLDVLVVVEEPTFPGCLVLARVIGLLEMQDEKGQDEKVLAVPVSDPRFHEVHELNDLPSHWLREIEAFFATYKILEDKAVEVRGWHDREAAWRVINECRQAFNRRRT